MRPCAPAFYLAAKGEGKDHNVPPPHLKATDEEIIEALRITGGEYAATGLRVGMSRSGILRRIERTPALAEAREEAIKSSVEIARTCLFELVKKRHFQAIKFLLEHKDPDFRPKNEFVQDNKPVRSPEEIDAEIDSMLRKAGYKKAGDP